MRYSLFTMHSFFVLSKMKVFCPLKMKAFLLGRQGLNSRTCNLWLSIGNGQRQPEVGGSFQVELVPAIGHKNEVVLLSFQRQDKCTLCPVGTISPLTGARIAIFFPGPQGM